MPDNLTPLRDALFSGRVRVLRRAWTLPGSLVVMTEVCDACGGTGIRHCCDGLRASPEEISPTAARRQPNALRLEWQKPGAAA